VLKGSPSWNQRKHFFEGGGERGKQISDGKKLLTRCPKHVSRTKANRRNSIRKLSNISAGFVLSGELIPMLAFSKSNYGRELAFPE
jgi:hypothetical protein